MFGVRARIRARLAPSGLWATALPASWLLRGGAGPGGELTGRIYRPWACGIPSRSRPVSAPPSSTALLGALSCHLQAPDALTRERISGTGVFQGKPDIRTLPGGAPHPAPPLPHTGASQARSACRLEQIPMLWVPPGASDSAVRDSGSFRGFPGASTGWPSLRTQLLQVFP